MPIRRSRAPGSIPSFTLKSAIDDQGTDCGVISTRRQLLFVGSGAITMSRMDSAVFMLVLCHLTYSICHLAEAVNNLMVSQNADSPFGPSSYRPIAIPTRQTASR